MAPDLAVSMVSTYHGFTLEQEEVALFREAIQAQFILCETSLADGDEYPPNSRAAPVKYQLAIIEEIAIRLSKPLSQSALAKKKRRHADFFSWSWRPTGRPRA